MLYLLPHAVLRAAERKPDHEAIRCGGQALSYGALAVRSARLASVLRARGVGRGDRVAIYSTKGLDSATAIYGIMSAGAAYVPLDPGAPRQRLEMILQDCGIRHIVSEPARTGAVAALVASGAAIDAVIGTDPHPDLEGLVATWEQVDSSGSVRSDPCGMEQDLAYVLYTSGSTGTPKGVMHTHRSALAFAEVAAKTFGLVPEDRLSNHAPLHFDLSTLDYFAGSVAGATTVVIPEAHTRFPASFSQLAQDERLTVLYAVPLALTHLALHGALDQRDLSSVRWVLFGGEPFPTKQLCGLMRALPMARFSNVYGPTEVNGVTFWPVPASLDEGDAPIPIGDPFPNVDLIVVDENDETVADGEAGELLARTPTMMRGYWGRPDLDDRAFYVRPAVGGYADVFHRTGDLVRRRPDGALDFLGRRDRQVKVRGYRIELDEVEVALNSHPSVEFAAVFVIPGEDGVQRILAAVELAADPVQPQDLIEHAARRIPGYALPEVVEVLDQLPKTSTGKIDRLALRARAMNAL